MEESLKVVLDLTAEDMGQFSIEKNRRKTHIVMSLILFVAITTVYGVVGWLLNVSQNVVGPITIIIISLVLPMFFIEKFLFKKGQENFNKVKEHFPSIELSINKKTIFMNAGDTRTKYEWKDIIKVDEYGSCFCILVNKTNGMLVPKRFFEDEEISTIRGLAGEKLKKCY